MTDSGYLEKRPGNIRVGTISNGSPILNLNEYLTAGRKFLIIHASTTIYGTDFGGSPTAIFTTTAGYAVDSVSAFGRHYFVNKLEPGLSWDGTSTFTVTGMPLCKFIEFADERLYCANTGASASRVSISSFGADNGWTVPAILTADSPNSFTFQNNDGEDLTCFKKTPWGKFAGKPHSSHVLKNYDNDTYYKRLIHPRIGCTDDRSFQMADDIAIWLGKDAIYGWDGSNPPFKLSQEIEPLVLSIRQLGNDDKFTDTTEADFKAGTTTLDAVTYTFNATTVTGSIYPSTIAFVDTSTNNFSAGTSEVTLFAGSNIQSISTNAPMGSLSLAVTTIGFRNAGFQDSDSLTVANGWTIGSQDFTDQFSVVATTELYGNKSLRFEKCNNNTDHFFLVEILGSDASTVLISSNISLNQPQFTQRSLTTGTINIDGIKISSSNTYLRLSPVGLTNTSIMSASFYQGKILQFTHKMETCDRSAACQAVVGFSGVTRCTFFDMPFNVEQRLTSGTFTSRSFDTAMSSPSWGPFDVSVTTSQDYRINFMVETSVDGTSSWSPRIAINELERPNVLDRRYIRYVSSFSSTDGSATSRIDDVTMSAVSTGAYFSQVHSIGTDISKWGIFNVTDNVTPSGRISYYVRGSSSAISVLSSTPGWTAQTNNQAISISTFPFLQWAASTTIHSTTETARIDQAVVSWFEGSSITAASAFYNGRYFLSVTTSPSSTSNDLTLVWQKNKKWTIFKGPSYGALTVFDNNLYAGDASTSSFVWKTMQPGTYNDDGSAISSQWVTKDFNFGQPIQYKSLGDIWIETKSTTNTLLTLGFAANKNENFTSKDYNLGTSSATIIKRIPGLVDGFAIGKYFKFKIANNQKDQSFRFNSLGALYSVAPTRFDDDE